MNWWSRWMITKDNTKALKIARQNLRDITEGVNTEAKVKAVVFPDKP